MKYIWDVKFLALGAMVLLLPGMKCSSSECSAAKLEMDRICSAAPESTSCLAAKAAYEVACKPSPVPTITPTPVPTPTPTPTPTPVPTPTPTPIPVDCYPSCDAIKAETAPILVSTVSAVISKLKAEKPSLFTPDFNGLSDKSYVGLNNYYSEVIRELALVGVCAKQTDDANDKVSAVRSDGLVEAYHLINQGGFLLVSPEAAVQRGGVWKPLCNPVPTSTPTPSNDATLCASDGLPVPKLEGCGSLGDISWSAHYGHYRDFTPKINACKDDLSDPNHYCRLIGSMATPTHGNKWCPARVEGGNPLIRQACERVAVKGGMIFKCESGVEAVINPANPFQATCPDGSKISACNADSTSCYGPYQS